MKKIIAILLMLTFIFTLSVTAFAVDSPVAKEQVTVMLRKGTGVNAVEKADVKYTLDGGAEVAVVADEAAYGTFNGWSIYKVVSETKTVTAAVPADYEIVKGSLTSKELTILAHTDIIICANYGGAVTDPLSSSTTSGTDTDESPQTGDMLGLYAVIIMLASVVAFSAKKQFAK